MHLRRKWTSWIVRRFLCSVAAIGAQTGCVATDPAVCVESVHGDAADVDSVTGLHVGSGDVYQPGALRVISRDVRRCEFDAPVDLRVHAPDSPGEFAVVVFQHGFQARNAAYDEILRHVASHGFVVVAPQMYEPGIASLFGRPTAAEESIDAARVLDWIPGGLSAAAGVGIRPDRIGLAGHSRGGKVAWLVLKSDSTRALAVAGIDPVDGAGGPLGGQTRAVQGTFSFSMPVLVIGAGLGGACAPTGDNHEQFYAASQSPAWHVIAEQSGHADMLNEEVAAAASLLCPSGSNRRAMRALTAGLLTAFFRASLQGDSAAYAVLLDANAAPAAIRVESK